VGAALGAAAIARVLSRVLLARSQGRQAVTPGGLPVFSIRIAPVGERNSAEVSRVLKRIFLSGRMNLLEISHATKPRLC
jgi:hypothetical protein